MAILVCRVAWMPGYRSDEEQAIGGGGYVVAGNVPHESRNFLPIGDTYMGSWRIEDTELGLRTSVDSERMERSPAFQSSSVRSIRSVVNFW